MQRALVTGGNGLVGSELISLLLKNGFEVYNLSRSGSAPKGAKGFAWNHKKKEFEHGALEGVDVIFHLAGASVAEGRWTNSRKTEIYESRIQTTELLLDHISRMEVKPKHFISASGLAFYGVDDFNTVFTEEDKKGNGFLADVSEDWEKGVKKFSEQGILNSSIRIPMVLSGNGGALKKLMGPVKLGVGSPLASGLQRMPWIHIEDLVNLFLFVFKNQLEGVYNAVADENLTNKEFTKQICKAAKRPMILPNVPSFALRIILGEMADQIAINGSAASNEKIKRAGFSYRFDNLKEALENLLSN